MKKHRFTAALSAACLVLALALPAVAAAPVPEEEAAQVVSALGIMVGDARGEMNLSGPVTRAEFVTMAVKATPAGDQVGQAAVSPYPDVPRGHWASGYVEAGVAAGLVSGYSDGTFRPNSPIVLAEGAAIVLRLLGYGPADFSGAYPTGQLALYRSLKLDRGVTAAGANSPLARRDAMYLFYNLMTADTKEGRPYLETLGYSLNAAGELDLVALINQSMEGPVVARGSWQDSIPFAVQGAGVRLEGKTAAASDIREGDVVYWNRGLNTLWVYRDRVTGTIQALEPSSSAPTSVTVAGRTCPIETASAAYALSDLGRYGLGDTVTLLLGRNGAVAAVSGWETSGPASPAGQVGVVTAVETASYSDGRGGSYTARTAVVLCTDGKTYRYEAPSGQREGNLVQVTLSGEGKTALKSLPTSSLAGKVNGTGTKVGSESFAESVEILDVSGSRGVRVYPSRLAGLSLSGSMVRYYSKNSSGEIDRMVLNDVTGDVYQYGVLTSLDQVGEGEFASYTYELDVGGESVLISQTSTRYPVEAGPIRLKGTLQAPEGLLPLNCAKTGEVSGNRFLAGSRSYTISDRAAVYELRNGDYYLSSLSRVRDGGYTLTGWYDKTDADGGRIRVIVAREK